MDGCVFVLKETFEFVSIVKAVKDTMSKELDASGKKDAFILGSAVTMTPKGEYKALYPPFTDVRSLHQESHAISTPPHPPRLTDASLFFFTLRHSVEREPRHHHKEGQELLVGQRDSQSTARTA